VLNRIRQCQGPLDRQREGVQVSMSQRPYPASRRSSHSPALSSPSSQRNLAHQDDTNARPPHDPGGASVTEGEVQGQRRGSRASGVHNILNPPGSRGLLPESSSPLPRPPGEANSQVKMEGGQYRGNSSPPHALGHQSHGAATPQPSHQAIPSTHSPGGPPPLGSPPVNHPYPLAAARRILTPKSPRAASLSRAAMRSVEAQRLASLPPHPSRATGPTHDASPLGGPPALGGSPQFPGPMSGPGPGPGGQTPSRPTSGLSRSLSQPVMGHGLPPALTQEPLPATTMARELGPRSVFPPGPPFTTHLPPNRRMLGETRWGGGMVGPLPASGSGARNLQLGDGQQHMLAITPTHGEEILIPVDIHQASKQADEKRQRNAGASARFRQRKKEKEKEQQQGLQKLESQNRELEKKIEELERGYLELEEERDFYRSERNRLRDLVARTPGMSEWIDRGPPSPTPERRGSSYSPLPAPAPATPLPQPHPHPHPHSHPYQPAPAPSHTHALAHPHPPPSSYGDPSMLERPARRRRTDSEPHLGTPTYRPTTPASLPPLPTNPPPAYSIPPSPHLSTSPGTARLPPIRFDHPLPAQETPPTQGGPPPPPPPQQPGQTSAYPSYGKAPYETGWATGPRGPNEGGPR